MGDEDKMHTEETDVLVLNEEETFTLDEIEEALTLNEEEAAETPLAVEEIPLPSPYPERRGTLRVRPAMDCSWGATETCPRNGQITSLSSAGCFVKTKAEVSPGQTLYVNCWLPTERWLLLRGEVAYHLPKVGFGLIFQDLADTDSEMLSMILDFYGD